MVPTRRRGLRAPSAGPTAMGHSLDSHELSARRLSVKSPLATNRGISVDTYLLRHQNACQLSSDPADPKRERHIIPTITCEFVGDFRDKLPSKRVQHSQSYRSFDVPLTRPQMRRMSLHSFRDRTGSFTRPKSPISIDMSNIPSKLTHLHRSPDHCEPEQVFDSTFSGTYTKEGFRSSSGIILTDVALNQTPDLVLSSPNLSPNRSKSSTSTQASSKRSSGKDTPAETKPVKKSFFARIALRLWNQFSCGAVPRPKTKADDSKDEMVSQSSASSKEYEEDYPQEESTRNNLKQDLSRSQSHADEPAKTKKHGPTTEWTILDLQREKERQELLPSRYIEDIKVLHNIHRREMVSKLLYREEGQLFYRRGTSKDPHPPLPPSFLLAGPTPPPPLKRNLVLDPFVTHLDRHKILQKVMSHNPKMSSSFAPDNDWSFTDDTQFLESCLRAHNVYRARHSASPLKIAPRLCFSAQFWANRLAQTGHLFHRRSSRIGENLFCRNVSLAIKSRQTTPDISGEEVAAYWYSNVRDYRFNLESSALQAHAGSFSQMVWVGSQMFGVGKALSRGGKLIVVAHYFPPGNLNGKFRHNVLSLSTRALAAEMMSHGKAMLEENRIEQERENDVENESIRRRKAVSGVLAAQPPNIIGRNATKILAAHMLGHAASVVTTPEDKLDVIIFPRHSKNKKKMSPSFSIDPEFEPIRKTSDVPVLFHTPRKLTKSVSLSDVTSISQQNHNSRRKSMTKKWPVSFNCEPRKNSRASSSKLVRSKAIQEDDDNAETNKGRENSEVHSSLSSNSVGVTTSQTHLTSSEGYLEPMFSRGSMGHSSSSPSSSSMSNIPMFVPQKCKLRKLRFSDDLCDDSLEPIEPISLDLEPSTVEGPSRPQIRMPHSGSGTHEGFYNGVALSPLRY